MARFLAGAAACFLLLTGAFFLWQSHAEKGPELPPAPKARVGTSLLASAVGGFEAPAATEKSRDERRFSRADKNKDGRIESEELLGSLTDAEYATTAPPPPKHKRCSC